MIELIHAISEAKNAMQGIIVYSWAQDCLHELSVVIHGDWASKRMALFLLFGLAIVFKRGLWKMVAKVFGHWAWERIW